MDKPVTPFQHSVYEALKRIPVGSVVTYKTLAHAINCASAQAVGQALRANPFAPEVPCHRVVRSDGRLGGYAGELQGEKITRKRNLLAKEGVYFDDNGCLLDTRHLLAVIPE